MSHAAAETPARHDDPLDWCDLEDLRAEWQALDWPPQR